MGPRALVFLLGVLTAIAPLSTDMYLPGLPEVGRSLGISAAAVMQTVSMFFVGMAIGQLFHGPLSDRWGRKPVLVAGVAAYLVASLGCAFAESWLSLVLWRLMQAIGGCAGVVTARAVARDRFEQHDLLRVLAFLVIVMSISPLIAPLCGGWILLTLGWRAIFLVQAGLAALLLVMVIFGLEETRTSATRDLARAENPLKAYVRLLKERGLHRYFIAACAPAAAAFCWVAASATIVMETYGVAPGDLGYVYAVNGLGMAAANYANVRLTKRWPPHRILRLVSYACVGIALWLMASAWTGAGGLLGILVPIFLLIASLAFTQTNALAGAMAEFPLRAGSLSALLGSGMYFAGAAAAGVAGWAGDGSPRATSAVILALSLVAAWNAARAFQEPGAPRSSPARP